ncbi:hypothetical protein CHLNCDRAFT_136591 [Chlorella variabilis]|uniref:Derlin n=1 Tax=Chlorella variabilis TaxID=554065 RepID=E1ZUD5_CHLVA|nr:hypothetical protein CHLNCDRAFT_136591 [Chlorella variabilis]EFN50559.1 hypothetical protein CHLNCDRAFT_136591 [Chlorella variabilis]|eukprot:XP_005842691.1 hypothetical protein CHLNCDRAFT_136591 [Chlorella variabilis]
MPPREIRQVGDRGAADWYTALPPITRGLLTCYLVTGLAAFMGVMPLQYVYHSWQLCFKRVPEVWRLVTNFTFLGKPSLGWLFQLVWLVQYGGAYEQAKFASNTADGITAVAVGMATGMSLDLLSYLCRAFLPPVSLFGFIKLNGRHLPFAFLALDLLMGQDIWSDVMGILMGHMYWFLTDVYPVASGRHVIQTPRWLSRLCLQHGIGRVPIQAVNPINPSDVRFRAFQGRGRRLGD